MIVALDTDALVSWAMSGAPRHQRARRFVEAALAEGKQIGLLPQTVWEFLHVITDGKRFETPLSMEQAIELVRELRASPDVTEIGVDSSLVDRVFELLQRHRLGRKRILDTALAAALEAERVTEIATFNAKDFGIFTFLKTVTP